MRADVIVVGEVFQKLNQRFVLEHIYALPDIGEVVSRTPVDLYRVRIAEVVKGHDRLSKAPREMTIGVKLPQRGDGAEIPDMSLPTTKLGEKGIFFLKRDTIFTGVYFLTKHVVEHAQLHRIRSLLGNEK